MSGTSDVGGLIGYNTGTVSGSFWDMQTSGMSTSEGGTGLTTKQMQSRGTFIEAGWDFKNVWTMKRHGYPVLRSFLQ